MSNVNRVSKLMGHLAVKEDETALRNAGVSPEATAAGLQTGRFGAVGSKSPDDVVIVSVSHLLFPF